MKSSLAHFKTRTRDAQREREREKERVREKVRVRESEREFIKGFSKKITNLGFCKKQGQKVVRKNIS